MFKRLVFIAVVISLLTTLIVYSKFREVSDHVSGFIEADEIRVGSRLGGRVQKVHVVEGQQVTRGQLLIDLEPFDLLEQEEQAKMTLAAREAEYKNINSGLRPEEIAQAKARYDQLKARLALLEAGPRSQEIQAAKGRLDVAKAELTLAQKTHERRLKLVTTNAVSEANLEAAREMLSSAEAMLIVRQNELELLEVGTREEEKQEARARVEEALQAWELAKKGFRPEEIESAKAARDAAKAALDRVLKQKKELSVTSPVDGTIEALDLQVGDLVAAGAPILSIQDEAKLWVRAYIPENRVGLQTGDLLEVTANSYPGERFKGEITYISRNGEFTPSNVQTPDEQAKQVFRTKVTLQDGHGKLRPGMAADVWLAPVKEGK